MEALFQRFGWAINFVLIGLGTLFAALLINSFIASQLAEWTVPSVPSFELSEVDETPTAADDEREHWVDEITARCLFGCPEVVDPDECPEGCPDGEVCEAGECIPEEPIDDEEDDFDGVPRLTQLEMKLSGVLAADNPRWSMAMILDESEQETHVVGVGDALPADDPVEVIEIRRDRVFIERDGRMEFIRLEDSPYGDPEVPDSRSRSGERTRRRDGATRDEARGETERDRAARRRAERREQREERQDSSGVVREGEGRYTVDRDRVEEELDDPNEMVGQARAMPNYRDGEPDGLRLVGVTSDSFYSDMGIRSGDVLQSINGETVNDQQEVMEMMETMGDADEVTIELERRGQRQEKNYRIR